MGEKRAVRSFVGGSKQLVGWVVVCACWGGDQGYWLHSNKLLIDTDTMNEREQVEGIIEWNG